MVQNMDELVVKKAKSALKRWRNSGDEGTGDKLAKDVTNIWQASLKSHDASRFSVEHQIAQNLDERIDVVDLASGIAYEMKVSPNNPHHEFYKDIFKVVLARDNGLPQIVMVLPLPGHPLG